MRYLTDKSTETLHPLVNLDAKLQKKKYTFILMIMHSNPKKEFFIIICFFLPFKIYLKLQNMENEI